MASKFENFDLGRYVAKFLNIKDPKNFPVHLNTDELQPVLSLPGPNAPEIWKSADLVNKLLVGLSTWAYTAFGPNFVGNANDVANPVIFATNDSSTRAHWIRAISISLTYDAAGAVTENGVIRQFFGWLHDPSGTGRLIFCFQHQFEVKTGILGYSLAWPECDFIGGSTNGKTQSGKGWNGYVPPGWNFIIQIGWGKVSTNYPANTTVNGQIAVSEMPDGMTYSGPT